MASSTNNNPSIYISHVYSNITWKQVKDIFEDIFGDETIGRVDVVKGPSTTRDEHNNNNNTFNRVYVHFKHWPRDFHELRSKLVDGDTVKIVYDDPRYWICRMNKVQKSRKAPYVDMQSKSNGRSDVSTENVHTKNEATTAMDSAPTFPSRNTSNKFGTLNDENDSSSDDENDSSSDDEKELGAE